MPVSLLKCLPPRGDATGFVTAVGSGIGQGRTALYKTFGCIANIPVGSGFIVAGVQQLPIII